MIQKTDGIYQIIADKNNSRNIDQKVTIDWSMFDKIVCIHYLPYKERLEPIKKELARVGILDLPQFEFYYTVDNELYYYVLDGIPDGNIDRKRVDRKNIKYTIDSFALLKRLQFFQYKKVLIIEDDVVFHKDLKFIQSVVASTPSNFDIMNYDPEIIYQYDALDLEKINDYIFSYKNTKVVNMSCCALSNTAINYIIKKQQEILRPFDIYTWINASTLNSYCTLSNKNLCVQNVDLYNERQSPKSFNKKYKVIDVNNYQINQSNRQRYDVIVSFTTYKDRFLSNEIYEFLESIVNQKCNVSYHIVATIFSNDIRYFPQQLEEYFNEHNIELIVSENNYKSHLKYLYAMQKYNDIPVIIVDDDNAYEFDMVQLLYDDYLKNDNIIIGGRCKCIKRDNNRCYLDYNSWNVVDKLKESFDIFPTGTGGILYPPQFCQLIDVRTEQMIEDSGMLEVDDIFLNCIAQENNIQSKVVYTYKQLKSKNFGYLVKKQLKISFNEKALYIHNNLNNNNNNVIKKIVNPYIMSNYCFKDFLHLNRNNIRKNLDVVVSLTSYKHRLLQKDFKLCLQSLVEQKTNVNYKIILSIFNDDLKYISADLLTYIKQCRIEILQCNLDLRQHKKYFYAMQKYNNIPVITVDDDTIYSENLINDLYKTHLKNQDKIICGRCSKITYDSIGEISNYDNWIQNVTIPNYKDENLFGVGVGGILYPKEFCKAINSSILDLIPKIVSDDMLLFLVAQSLGIKYMTVNTNNLYVFSGGIGFLGKSALDYHNDSFAMYQKNRLDHHKDNCIKYIGKAKTIQQLIDLIS